MNGTNGLKPAVVMDFEDGLGKAVSELMKTRTCVVVTKDGAYFGIVDDRHIRHITDPSTTKLGTVAVRAPVISPTMQLLEMCKLFFTGKFKALPVIENTKVLGVLTRADVLKELLDGGLLANKNVREAMSSPVCTVDENESMAKARAKMHSENVAHLIVTIDGLFAGVITSFDMLRLEKPVEKRPFVQEKIGIASQPVKSFMREGVETISPGASIADGARIMVKTDTSAVPVVDGGKPVGFITARDILETVIPREHPNIHFIGLEGNDRSCAPEIMNSCEKLMEKLKHLGVEYLVLHVKNRARMYSVRGRLNVRGRIVSASASDWNLHLAVKYTLAELGKMMQKEKPSRMHKTHHARRGEEVG